MNTVYWNPSADPLIEEYDLSTAPASTGPWVDLITITHLIPGPNYSAGPPALFYYEDTLGGAGTWYRIRAKNTLGNYTSWSDPFVAGLDISARADPDSTATLLASIRLRASIPTGDSTFSDSDLLALADEELRSSVVPLILSVREDYLTTYVDMATTAGSGPLRAASYRIPSRAVGSKVRAVNLVSSSGTLVDLPRVSPHEAQWAPGPAFYVDGSRLVTVNVGTDVPTIRAWFHVRPGRLVTTSEAGRIASFDTVNKTVTLRLVPSDWPASASFDFYRGRPPFDVLAIEMAGTVGEGYTVTFTDDLPDGLAVGDHLALYDQAAIPQVPVEFHPVLAQGVAVKVLESLGDTNGLGMAQGKLKEVRDTAVSVISDRSEGNMSSFSSRHGPWWTSRSAWRP